MHQTQPATIEQAISKAKKAVKQGRFNEAVQLYTAVLQYQPQNSFAKKALRKLKIKLEKNPAILTQDKEPSQEQHNALMNLINARQYVSAEQSCRQLLLQYPQSLLLLNMLAGVLTEQDKFQEAVRTCDMMIRIKPDHAHAYYNRGVALQKSLLFEDAIQSFRQAIKLKPDYAKAYSDLSLLLLMTGDFKEGWRHHEWRMMEEKANNQIPVAIPQWKAESLENSVILVRAEQGIGDEVMFASCFPDLINTHPKQIIVECDSRLVPLFSRSFPEMNIQGKRDEKSIEWLNELGDIDFQVALGSLPMFFRAGFEFFPDRKSYLSTDPVLLEKWKHRFDQLGEGIKIGISWRGGSSEDMKQSRSVLPALWKPVLQSDAYFINLQYGDTTEDIHRFERETGTHIHHWADADPLIDLDNFAAQISALDLVISIDNSTVHFAGAVGTPTWVLTPGKPDWRWMLETDSSPWYSVVKLFRQKKDGDWSDVLSQIKTELSRYSG